MIILPIMRKDCRLLHIHFLGRYFGSNLKRGVPENLLLSQDLKLLKSQRLRRFLTFIEFPPVSGSLFYPNF